MTQAILNFLATRLGAYLAPLFAGAIASGFAWVGQHIPWGIGAYLASPESQTAIMGAVFGALMIAINGITTTRAVKFTKPLQTLVNVLARVYGIPPVDKDGVAGPVTAEKAEVLAASVKLDKANTVQDIAKDLNESATVAGNPNRKG